MNEREILIADKDTELRRHVADFFRHEGYRVETTDSAVHVLCSILERQTPVILLNNNFDRKVNTGDLVHLLKKCNRQVSIIMVSDDMPEALSRKLRQEGIFYHALRPTGPEDTAEIRQAVDCAFERFDAQSTGSLTMRERGTAESITDLAATRTTHPADGRPAGFNKETDMKTLRLIASAGALVLAVLTYAFAAVEENGGNGNMFVWIFFGMCALIIIGQLLPLMRTIPRETAEKAAETQQAAAPARNEER